MKLLVYKDVNPKMGDEQIIDWAVREERVIVTTDNNFEQMIWLQQKSIVVFYA